MELGNGQQWAQPLLEGPAPSCRGRMGCWPSRGCLGLREMGGYEDDS